MYALNGVSGNRPDSVFSILDVKALGGGNAPHHLDQDIRKRALLSTSRCHRAASVAQFCIGFLRGGPGFHDHYAAQEALGGEDCAKIDTCQFCR